MSKKKLAKILYFSVLLSFIVPIVFLVVKITVYSVNDDLTLPRPISDYLLMLLECILGVIVIHFPAFLERRFRFVVPSNLYYMYLIFLYCAIFLGEIRDFYYLVPGWDVILHTFSSLMSGSFGFMVVDILNRNEHTHMSLSPLFVSVFAFCFALSIGALWEIYEYSFDGLLGLNMQKYRLADGTQLVGHAALSDTMKDIVMDTIGALAASILGFFQLQLERRRKKSAKGDT